ncbi:cell division protein FtsX [Bernardetia sp.]|uniref:cell division protein FtsX n=1 Tax=Bernardetia sp. TaxID=1937974 RepID=UPI0025BB1BF3|nr:permease-like cell division protein FtsX [Bernardetia sp.]
MQLPSINRPFSKKRIGSYPYIGVLINITLALFITGILGLILIYTYQFSVRTKENVEVEVYLRRDVNENQRLSIQKKLTELEFVLKDKEGKPRIRFMSSKEATDMMRQEAGVEFEEFLVGENRLPDAYYINVEESYYQKDKMALLKAQIESIEGVYEVDFKDKYIEEITKNLQMVSYIFFAFALVFFIAAVILIDSGVRLALFSQRFLIRSMQLVGAAPFFIKKPFLRRALFHGIIGSICAYILVLILAKGFALWIPELNAFDYMGSIIGLGITLLVLGISINTVSAYIAVSKYLRMRLDDLY